MLSWLHHHLKNSSVPSPALRDQDFACGLPLSLRLAHARITAQLGYTTTSKNWSGVRELHPCFRTGDPGYFCCTNSALERAARVDPSARYAHFRVTIIVIGLEARGTSRYTMLALILRTLRSGFRLAAQTPRNQLNLAVATGIEPVPPDRQSGILPTDSATTCQTRSFGLCPQDHTWVFSVPGYCS